MSADLVFSALCRVIESYKTPAPPVELIDECAALLSFEGHKPDREKIGAAVMGAMMAGNDAIVQSRQPDGTFRIPLNPPKLLALAVNLAVPLKQATRADLLAHREFMKRVRTEAAAGGAK
jgi:hypothetical protein